MFIQSPRLLFKLSYRLAILFPVTVPTPCSAIPLLWTRLHFDPYSYVQLSFSFHLMCLHTKIIILSQRCHGIMARNTWSQTNDFPRNDCICRHRVQQLRQYDIRIPNGKLRYFKQLTLTVFNVNQRGTLDF